MNRIKRIRKRSIGILIVLLFVLSFSITPALLFSNYSFGSGPIDKVQNTDDLNLSTNYLFKGTSYTFNLDDFYDDTNLYKAYTGAKFQTEAFNQTLLDWSGTINNDTVTPVDNDETQYGTPSGDYNGTYSFEEDEVGGNPTGWDIVETGGTINVIAEKDGHEKVLEFYDDDPTYRVDATNTFDTIQIDATIEFWWAYSATETLNHYFGIYFKEDTGVRFQLFLNYLWDRLGSIQYRDSIGYHPTGYYDNPINTMVHIKLEFDDSNNEAEFTVNGISYGSFPYYSNSTIGIDNIFMFTRTVNGGDPYWHWIDAVGYKSECYLATYGFDDQPIGTSGTDIYGINTVSGGTATIVSDHENHEKVVHFNTTIASSVYMYPTTPIISGTMEWYLDLTIGRTYQRIVQNNPTMVIIDIETYPTQARVRYGDGLGGAVYTGYHTFTTDFPHFRITFDCTTDKASVWIEDVLVLDNQNFINDYDASTVYRIGWYNNGATEFYLDAMGYYPLDPDYNIGDNKYSWDKDYTIGENLYPDNINMINGSYDYTDNMKINDDSSTNFTSTHTDGYIYEMPSQWDDLTFTEGTGITIGEIETIDANNSVIRDDYFGIDDYITIIPNEDGTPLDWMPNPPGTHWSKIDENPDSNDGETTQVVVVMDNGVIDVINYTSGDIEGCSVYKIVVRYAYKGTGPEGYDAFIDINLGGWQGFKEVTRPGIEFTAQDLEWTGLSGSQSDVDDLQISLKSRISGLNANYFTAVWVKVYYSKLEIDLDVQVDIQVDDEDCSSVEYFKYSHKTNVSATIDLDIWNWDTTTWFEIESVDNFASFDDDSFTLGLDSDYVNSSFGVRIRFQLNTGTNDFELQIDRFRLDYLTSPAELEMTITFSFTDYNEDLLGMTVQSWQKTNISQTITFKIWNYNTETWVQISSSSDTSFTKKEYNTESPSNFISPTGVVKLNWTGSNTTNDFELHIDYLFIQIFYKLDLVHEKSFDTNGIFRYRWCVLGSIYYTQWITFEIVDPVPNFHAISESEITTRWILQGSDISAVENFTDDISGSNWNLYDSERYMSIIRVPTDDAVVADWAGDLNTGDSEACGISWSWFDLFGDWIEQWTYIKYEVPYLVNNYSANSYLRIYFYSVSSSPDVKAYNTTDFDEMTITWNNKPASTGFIATTVTAGIGWKYITLNDVHDYYFLNVTAKPEEAYMRSSEHSTHKPTIFHNISKNYQGGGYMYMQTNTTELISLKSTDYGTHYTLSSGDYFEVDFQTNSDSQINLILLKDGVVNKTLTLSQSGNPNFNRHTVQVSVDEYVEFDQLKISSTFEDVDNVKVYDIKTKKYTITGDSADFRVGSKNDYEVYLTPDIYNLRIFEEGTKKIDINKTISSGYNFYVYEPTANLQCRLTLFSLEDEYLQFEDYHIEINRSLNGEYNQFWLLDTIFYADEETYVYIDVYDRFDSLIGSFERLTSDYIDLEIEVYSLQIKNLQTQKTTVDINTTHVYPLLSEESIYFMLAKDYYQIGYYDTNDVYKQFLIYLDSNQAYELNRSKICFLAYVNQKGEHLYFDDYKTYINDSLIYENVFYREIGDDIGIEVKDIYGISIKNQTYTVVSDDNYIPVVLTMYSLKVMSQQLCFNHINITRDPNYYESSYYWSEWIAPSEIINFRLFPGYYKINLTNNEDGGYSYYSYTLSGDDILLIGSNNTLYNVLVNIANVNATIGNQITNVQIDLTNQNSNINNTIINIEINIGNINSTLGTLLLDIDTAISNINSSIITEIVSLGTTINNINSSITNEILTVNTAITNVNSSVISQLLTLGVDISNINGSIVNQIIDLGVDVSNIGTSLSNQILSIGVDISNLDTSITDQIVLVISNITNINTTLSTQITSLSSDITNVNSTIVNQIIDLGVDITNINTSLSNQILSLEVDISNLDTSIMEQVLLVIAEIENIETVIDDQTLVILSDITNVNSTLLNQMVVLGVDITNINASITNQILSLSVDLTNINSSISNLLTNIEVSITNLENDIGTFYAFTNTSFINLNNVMNTSFINIENNIFSINQTISNLVIGVSNDIYLINGTISTMITQLETNLLLMNVLINTALFDLGTTLNLIGSNITSNYILLNNSIYLNSLNINDSRIAIINNLLLINNTISTLVSEVYSAVYLINNSIYTAVVDLGAYLSIMNNTISGNLSIVLQMNDFLTEIYQMTMFSDLLNWTDIGLNTSLLTSQIDAWIFVNNYRNQTIEVHLRYQDLIEKLVLSADDLLEQYLPYEGVEYREWSEELQEYIGDWKELDPDDKTVDFGFYDEEVPEIPSFDNTSITIVLIILIFIGVISLTTYFGYKYNKRVQKLKRAYAMQHTIDKELIEGAVRPRSSRMSKIK